MADKTLTGTPSGAATTQPAPDTFEISASVNLRSNGQSQDRFNLLITNPEAKAYLDALGTEFGFRAKNENDEYWVRATADGRTKNLMRLGSAGTNSCVIKGTLTIQQVVADGEARGHIKVEKREDVSVLTLRNGGRVLHPNRDPEAVAARQERASRFAARMGR